MLVGENSEIGLEEVCEMTERWKGVDLRVGENAKYDARVVELVKKILQAGHDAGWMPKCFQADDEILKIAIFGCLEDLVPQFTEVDFGEFFCRALMVVSNGGMQGVAWRFRRLVAEGFDDFAQLGIGIWIGFHAAYRSVKHRAVDIENSRTK